MSDIVGFLSDAHGNELAFKKGISILRSCSARHVYFLGDAIGYIPSIMVLKEIEALGPRISCIRGNHEQMLLEDKWNGALAEVYMLDKVKRTISGSQLEVIRRWPKYMDIEIGQKRGLLLHGSPDDATYGYVYPDSCLDAFEVSADVVVMGNSHYPFIRRSGHTIFINAGSCGLPRDDGRYGSVVVLDKALMKARIIRYDISSESRAMLERYPETHETVQNIFQRRAVSIAGINCD